MSIATVLVYAKGFIDAESLKYGICEDSSTFWLARIVT